MTGTGSPSGKALALGILSSMLFSITYLINNSMAQSGGDWMWSASLRFLLMLPVLLAAVLIRGQERQVFSEILRAPWAWLLWSMIGFGLFYAPLTFASAYGPSWLVAGTFQFTILAGALMTPLFRGPDGRRTHMPVRLLPVLAVMIAGVFLLQLDHARTVRGGKALLFALPVLLSAFAYPLGNRKTMALCQGRLTTLQRVLAMTVCSLPLWLLFAGMALARSGWPSGSQLAQSAVVAACSGLLATLIFFHATALVRSRPQLLALVESTQCGEVVFSLFSGVLLLHEALPGPMGWVGLALIVGGMVCNSLLSVR